MGIIGRITGVTPIEEYAIYLGIFANKISVLEINNTMSSVPFICKILSIDNDNLSKLTLQDLSSIQEELNSIANGYPSFTGNPMTYEEFLAVRRDKRINDLGI